MSITAEMPLPPSVLENKIVGNNVAIQTIKVPIGGTLDKPQLDREELNRQIAQVISEATQSAEKEINKQIDKGLNGLLNKLK